MYTGEEIRLCFEMRSFRRLQLRFAMARLYAFIDFIKVLESKCLGDVITGYTLVGLNICCLALRWVLHQQHRELVLRRRDNNLYSVVRLAI